MIYKFIALGIIMLLLIISYSLLVMVHEADERAERMYRRWKDERGNRQADK